MNRIAKLAALLCLTTLPAVAADLNGKWIYKTYPSAQIWGRTEATGAYKETFIFDFKVTGTALAGTLTAPTGTAKNETRTSPISNGKIDGENLSFDVVSHVYIG